MFFSFKMCIYVAFHRCAVATFGHVRLCTLPQVFLARLELLVSTHFNGKRVAYNEHYGKIEKLDATVRCPRSFTTCKFSGNAMKTLPSGTAKVYLSPFAHLVPKKHYQCFS